MLSVTMDDSTVENIQHWSENELVDWLRGNLIRPLSSEDENKLKTAKIDGNTFLIGAGDRSLFTDVGLGTADSAQLAKLAETIVGKKSKCCSPYHTCF